MYKSFDIKNFIFELMEERKLTDSEVASKDKVFACDEKFRKTLSKKQCEIYKELEFLQYDCLYERDKSVIDWVVDLLRDMQL